ncbi:hypothetical protein BCAR13_520109 [Paraburkholderia caribensis]|nr:hypothetical protein BCAR13_520109 [Paraburkholderia caribensis]
MRESKHPVTYTALFTVNNPPKNFRAALKQRPAPHTLNTVIQKLGSPKRVLDPILRIPSRCPERSPEPEASPRATPHRNAQPPEAQCQKNRGEWGERLVE